MAANPFAFLRGRNARILTAVLLLETAGLWAVSQGESTPALQSLSGFPVEIGAWRSIQEGTLDDATMEVLRADDVLSRTYAEPSSYRPANLFIAYFKSQRTGQAPHSPKNCLPGAGWEPSDSGELDITVPGRGTIRVNKYIVSKGEDKSVVLYWYQSHQRVIASEYAAKVYLVADAIRYNRTDTALVRVVVPVAGDEAAAIDIAKRFVQGIFPSLGQFLPA
ncbi:MAG TPA: EpsI family protein [Bryobacteraceae bacterium]|nr:EpsI family protein [Bryobacteraceae bacterium]